MSKYLPQPNLEPVPQFSGIDEIKHLVEILDSATTGGLQTAVNNFLDSLTNPALPTPYIRDINYSVYVVDEEDTRFTALIHYTTYG